jgi:creatinine amidohydrolase
MSQVQPGLMLEEMTWKQAQQALAENRVIVVPLGASCKQHGLHLPLNNDALIANWLARQLAHRLPVIIAPLVNVSYYPAFTDYPGSISIELHTARDLMVQICRSLAGHGASRFYVINTGFSTEQPLAAAQTILHGEGLRFDFLRFDDSLAGLDRTVFTQQFGSHADETETSLMLHIEPGVVDMKAARDDGAQGEGKLTRHTGRGIWSPSGVYGQSTLAHADKGRIVAQKLLEAIIAGIEKMSRS